MARAIHADRVRELDRAARERRLLATSTDERPVATLVRRMEPAQPVPAAPCGESAGAPA